MADELTRTNQLVTVFGGSGFLGRHVVRALAQRCWRVRVAVRRPALAFHLQPLGKVGQIHAVQANLRYPDSVSYTHLDVYKRQVLHSLRGRLSRGRHGCGVARLHPVESRLRRYLRRNRRHRIETDLYQRGSPGRGARGLRGNLPGLRSRVPPAFRAS